MIVIGIETDETEIEDGIVDVVTEADREIEKETEEIGVVVVIDPDLEIVRDLGTEILSVIPPENVGRMPMMMIIMM